MANNLDKKIEMLNNVILEYKAVKATYSLCVLWETKTSFPQIY